MEARDGGEGFAGLARGVALGAWLCGVEGVAAEDEEFEAPVAAKTLALQIADDKNADSLPLRLEPQN